MKRMVQARSKTTRENVIEAAEALVIEHGHAQVSMKDLVDRSGVSNGSIFHHFGSKDGVLQEIFVRERREYLGHVGDQIIAHEGDPCDALGEGARAALLFQAKQPERHHRLYTQFSHSDWIAKNAELWAKLALEIERPVMEWAVPHFAAGKLPILHPAAIQSFMLGPAELVFHQWRSDRMGKDVDELAQALAEFVSGGLKHLRDLYTAN